MNYLLSLLVVLFSAMGVSHAQDNHARADRHLTIHSSVLHQDREVIIHLPAAYQKYKRYPVIYLLDGEENMAYTCAATDKLSEAGVLPELIVIGIVNIDRTYDLTPLPRSGAKQNATEQSGGGDNFISFIGEELCPQIDSAYSTLPYRILIGHSYGGLLAAHALFLEKKYFNAFLTIDPSLYWSDYYLVKKIQRGSFNFTHTTLYTSSIINPQHPVDSSSNGVGITALKNMLNKRKFKGLAFTFQNFEEENHASVLPVSILNGLRYIFHDYYLPDVFSPLMALHPEKIAEHYSGLSEAMGTSLLPSEKMLDELGFYTLYELHNIAKAVDIFEMNTRYYPKSPHAFNSLSIACKELGDNSSSVKYYYISIDLAILQAADKIN